MLTLITLPHVAQLWVKPATASSLMPLYQNLAKDLSLLHHLLLCSPLYKSPCSKGKFPETSASPLMMSFRRQFASCHQQIRIYVETSDRWTFLSPAMMCFLLLETSSCTANEGSIHFFCHLNSYAKPDETATFSTSLSGHAGPVNQTVQKHL